ncbi:hypothetical protein PINS_up008605 [Pythium insidiosum]|nr:hypothetical protein PINS_up008605 [Pythium insidiosum]
MATTITSRRDAALRVLLERCSDLLCGRDGDCVPMEALAATSPALARVVDDWVQARLVHDVSRGHERRAIPVRRRGDEQHRSTEMVRGLCCFRYATQQDISLPWERHCLPSEVAAQLRESSELVQRIVRGRQVELFVASAAAKGWGVFAAQDIAPDEYIGEYTGEVISTAEMERRYALHYDRVGLNYVLALREATHAHTRVYRTNVDATTVGSFTRLINHSCEPSLRVDAVRVDSFVPRLVLFTRRAVTRGEELTFDYGDSLASSTPTSPNNVANCDWLAGGILTTIMSDAKTYDQVCEDATSAAESRLLEHFKLYGGEVWTIGTGCQHCRKPLEDVSALKRCAGCDAALFCDRDCQKNSWRQHKAECRVIAAMRAHNDTARDVQSTVETQLNRLGLATEGKQAMEPKAIGVATSLQMNASALPGWFFTSDYEVLSKEQQKEMDDAVLSLYALLRDGESWTRDKESFPRSSYTNVEAIPQASVHHAVAVEQLIAVKGHLLLFSAWLQHPEPPATPVDAIRGSFDLWGHRFDPPDQRNPRRNRPIHGRAVALFQ